MASSNPSQAQPVKLSLPLEYHQTIFQELRTEDELVILARGLGLLRLVTNLLHSYDAAGGNLILVVGADERENGWMGEGLAEHAAVSQAPRARGLVVVNTDLMGVPAREKMYRQGGVFSITSRILVVDLLTGLVDPDTITGVVVLHAERVVATSLEAFILRIYRQTNRKGFLKAFSDNPDPFTYGFAPLASFMRNLFLRKVSLWPRFHISVAKALEGKRIAEVIELEVPMTDMMTEVQNAIMECVEASIHELKKINAGLDMGEWNLDSALLKNFDMMIRRQLDPNWHRVSWKTKQIVSDLGVLRAMLTSILTFDAVSFLKHLDAIHAAHSPAPGSTRQSQSPWLFLDAAQTIFATAKRRVYERKANQALGSIKDGQDILASVRPVLEEQPKWAVLADVLEEIDRDIYLEPAAKDDSNGTILIMCQDVGTCRQLRDYLETMHVKPHDMVSDDRETGGKREGDEGKEEPSADFMMRKQLRDYLKWKKDFAHVNSALFSEAQNSIRGAVDPRTKLAAGSKNRPPPNKRRRVRGGGAVGNAATGSHSINSRTEQGAIAQYFEPASEVSALLAGISVSTSGEAEALQKSDFLRQQDPLEDMDDYFQLYPMDDLVVVHAYEGDQDERVLEETRPRYIIMYEPDASFIRRIETYRSSHEDRNVKVYFMYYASSVEEQRYLSGVRREKDNFTKLIKERASMSLVLEHHHQQNASSARPSKSGDVQEEFLRTINTRIAGGGKVTKAIAQPPRVVVDVREFRSTLPSLLHASGLVVVPCMLTVGDYVLSPSITVERKSIPDLVSSFKDGRLYGQCEQMFAHYENVMLLIEFDQNKSFTLEPFAEYGSSSGGGGGGGGGSFLSAAKIAAAAAAAASAGEGTGAPTAPNVAPDLQAKLVLLTLAFPKLRIIWSSSPYETAEIFQLLKTLEEEPDPIAAVRAGTDGGVGLAQEALMFNMDPREMLAAVPGVSEKNIGILLRECGSVREVANMTVEELDPLVGKVAARLIVAFFERDICA